MTARERQTIKKAVFKLLSMAVVAAGLAGMYGMRSDGAPPAGTEEPLAAAEASASAGEEPAQVMISQFYGAGGKSGVFSNDYVELYNPQDRDISLDDYILTYSSGREEGAAGSTIDSDGVRMEKSIGLAGTIPAHGYYLICGAGNTCGDEGYQIQSFNRKWADLIIDDKATVTLKLYDGSRLADMASTEGSSCQYMVSANTSVINEGAGRDDKTGEKGIRTFYWGKQVTPEYEKIYEPCSSYGAADGLER